MTAAATPGTADHEAAAPEFALLLSWLVPGLGHWYLGDRFRSLLFLVLVNGTFAAGLYMSRMEAVRFTDPEHRYVIQIGPLPALRVPPFSLLGQIGCGGWTVASGSRMGGLLRERWFPRTGLERPGAINPRQDVGILYTVLAGLLNLLVMHSAWTRARAPSRPRPQPEPQSEPESEPEHEPRPEAAQAPAPQAPASTPSTGPDTAPEARP